MELKLHCANIPSSDLPLHIPVDWLIRALALCSMLVQVFLVFGGERRYRSSHVWLIVWLAYMSADVVAISALGIMTHSVQTEMYGVWAPLLLLHLGGPDAITAYSTADNELWIRHGFIMIYQVLVAGYVMYLSSLQGYLLASAILLYIAGATKYGERTLALRYASYTQIVDSTQPIYIFMQHEHKIGKEMNKVEYNYPVMGEDQYLDKLKEMQQGGAVERNERWNSLLEAKEIVTIKNVWYQEGLQTTDNYILCLSHALFKMYRRRFVGLYFHESIQPKTRNFFIKGHLPCETLFKIVEMELKFIYDVLFSKSSGTAFSKKGTLMRLLNTCLLGVAGMLLYIGVSVKPAQKIVTYVLISVALVVEVIQLYRIVVSDWTMVWLVCTYTHHLRRPRRPGWFMFKLIQLAISLLGRVRKLGRNKYWKDSITQYSMIDACSSKWSSIWKRVPKFGDFIVPLFIKGLHMEEKPIENDFKLFIFEKLKDTCSPEDLATCRARIYGYDEYLLTMGCNDLKWASELDMEDLILIWHIATIICETDDRHPSLPRAGAPGDGATGAPPAPALLATDGAPVGDDGTGDPPPPASASSVPPLATPRAGLVSGAAGNGATYAVEPNNTDRNLRFSSLLSRYCAYLLVSHPNLLPLHSEIAKKSYIGLHYELVRELKRGVHNLKTYKRDTKLGLGTKLARQLMERSQEQRWEILSGYWAGLLIYMAVYNKALIHAECLACGGEFLSQVWALLGHMGCGEQSDIPNRKAEKLKEKLKREREEEEKKQKQRRREEKQRNEKRRREEGIEKIKGREERKNARKRERLKAGKEQERYLRIEEDQNQRASERQRIHQNPCV